MVISVDHRDYPTLLAEALDLVTALRFDVAAAAVHLGVSASQLVRVIRLDPAAGVMFNAGRKTAGLRPLSP